MVEFEAALHVCDCVPHHGYALSRVSCDHSVRWRESNSVFFSADVPPCIHLLDHDPLEMGSI